MKLLSAHVAGFGCFYDKPFPLAQDIVQIKEDNGWGKTTFADFLECMFYGMDDSRKRSIAENFRVKYRPFQGGVYGGTLTFSYQGNTYRIERVFGERPSQDISKIYDENNAAVTAFGERAERLGETLFGVDRESYRRSVYLPQGEIAVGAFTEDIKGKLTALLTAGAQTDSDSDPIALLEKAERELRSKRAPYKGRLDEVDARLSQLIALRAETEKYAQLAAQYLQKEREAQLSLQSLQQRYTQTESALSDYERRKEHAANRLAYEQLQACLTQAESRLATLNEFFNGNAPETLNVSGLSNAVEEYYNIKAETDGLHTRLQETETFALQKERALSEVAACEKTLETFRMLSLSQGRSKKEEKQEKKERKKRAGKRMGYALIAMLLFLGALLLGVEFIPTQPTFGWGLTGVGALGAFVSLRIFWKNAFPKKPNKDGAFADKTLNEEYERAKEEHALAQERYAKLCAQEKEYAPLQAELATKTQRQQALEEGIKAFLQNFRFAQTYDYRAALCTLQENVQAHAAAQTQRKDCMEKLQSFTQAPTAVQSVSEEEYVTLKGKKSTLDGEMRAASEAKAYYAAKREEAEEQAAKEGMYRAEEQALTAEKDRLEKRLYAVRSAKQLIIRARENLAAKYLTPVEENCKRYVVQMGIDKCVRFAADGSAYTEEKGLRKETDYYSAGLQGLWDFCIRLALSDSLFPAEKPVLILDDPFTDLDDKKIELGKRLLRSLSKQRQIIYCTCAQARTL